MTERMSEPGSPRLTVIRERDSARIRAEITRIRAAGNVPLVVDARAPLPENIGTDVPLPPDTAWATLTSGSTGDPRIILRSAASWAESFDAIGAFLELSAADVLLLPVPLISSMSLFSLAHAEYAGAEIRVPAGAVSGADLDRSTLLHGTPTSLIAVLDLLDRGIPHRLRAALIGGASLDPGIRERARNHGIHCIFYYGAAELSFIAVDADGRGLRAVPGVRLRIDEGILWVNTPFAASGYHRGHGSLTRSGSWLSVGDLASLDDEGILSLRGRADGAILTAGATVVPEDVEAQLRSIPGVIDAVVFGRDHPRIGSLLCAAIEADAALPSRSDLISAARGLLGVAQVPRRWYRTAALERTASGKPARSRIAQAALAGELERV